MCIPQDLSRFDHEAATDRVSQASLREHFGQPALDASARTRDVRGGIAGFLPFSFAGNRPARLCDRYIFDGVPFATPPKSMSESAAPAPIRACR